MNLQEEKERARSRPPSRGASGGPQERKLQMLKKQADRKDKELTALLAEVEALVSAAAVPNGSRTEDSAGD
jgi:hypothetical protein